MLHRVSWSTGGALLCVSVWSAGPVLAQCLAPERDLFHAGDASTAGYGSSVSVTDHAMLVGAPGDSDPGAQAGEAYLYDFVGNAWQESILSASDAAAGDAFGTSVGLDGGVAIVGAPGADVLGADDGAAYVFRFNGSTWVQEQKLFAAVGNPSDQFGSAVAVCGDVAVVGAPSRGRGRAYVFTFNGSTWVESQIVAPAVSTPGAGFAASLDIDGDLIVGGAPFYSLTSRGRATVFRFNGTSFVEEADLFSSDLQDQDQFGNSVGVSGDAIVVGAVGADDSGVDSGAAYVFRFDGTAWQQEVELRPLNTAPDVQFGTAVGVHGDVAIVGSTGRNNGRGNAYLFRKRGANWLEERKLKASDRMPDDNHGGAVAIAQQFAGVGAPGVVATSGAAYGYEVADFGLAINPDQPAPGATMTLDVCAGPASQPVLVFVVAINAGPTFIATPAKGALDGLGSFQVSGPLGAGPGPMDFTFRAYSLESGHLVHSNDFVVTFP